MIEGLDQTIARLSLANEEIGIYLKMLPVAHRTIARQKEEIEEARQLARRLLPIAKPEVPGHSERIDEIVEMHPWLREVCP